MVSVILDVQEDQLPAPHVVDLALTVSLSVPRAATERMADDLRWSSPNGLDVPLTLALEIGRYAVSCLNGCPCLLVSRVD
jgi:hypothetical protein